MKHLLLPLFLSTFIIAVNSQSALAQTDSIRVWTPLWQKQYLEDRENPCKWDKTHFLEDLEKFPHSNQEPITPGVFPVADYNLYPGTFDGIIAANLDIFLPSGQRIACTVSGNSRTTLNEPLIKDNDEDFFFILAVVTDFPKDTISFDDVNIDSFSRNHPDVITQGYVRTSETEKIEFVAFRAANNDAYAIVNMRLFNLNDGNIVIIVPQEDGSLRSMQVKPEELLTFGTLRPYLTNLLTENKRITKFVTTRRDGF